MRPDNEEHGILLDRKALEHSSFPPALLLAEAIVCVLTNHTVMLREEDLGRKIPQARGLYEHFSTTTKAVTVVPKSVSQGPFDFDYPVFPVEASRVRGLDGLNKPELLGKEYKPPQGYGAKPKLLSFAALMQKVKSDKVRVTAVDGNVIEFVSDEVNRGLAQCDLAFGGEQRALRFRINVDTPQEDPVRDAFAEHMPSALEQCPPLQNKNFLSIQRYLAQQKTQQKAFVLEANVVVNGDKTNNWQPVLVLSHERYPLRNASDVDDAARTMNCRWQGAADYVRITGEPRTDADEVEKAKQIIQCFLQDALVKGVQAYGDEPAHMIALRKALIRAMFEDIGASEANLAQAAEIIFNRYAQDTPIGVGSALNIVFAEMKHYLYRQMLLNDMPETLIRQLKQLNNPNSPVDLVAAATNTSRHQPDTDFDPPKGCTKVPQGAPKNWSAIAPLKTASAALRGWSLRDITEAIDKGNLLLHIARYLRARSEYGVAMLHCYCRKADELAAAGEKTRVSMRYSVRGDCAAFFRKSKPNAPDSPGLASSPRRSPCDATLAVARTAGYYRERRASLVGQAASSGLLPGSVLEHPPAPSRSSLFVPDEGNGCASGKAYSQLRDADLAQKALSTFKRIDLLPPLTPERRDTPSLSKSCCAVQ